MIRSLIAILVLSGCALAQSSFWTPERKAETGVYAAAIAVDNWSSDKVCDPWKGYSLGCNIAYHEHDPLARPFIGHGVGRQTIGASLGFAAGIVPSYLLHRTHHEKLSRWWLRTFTVAESANAARMGYLYH
jgi:hypothetical protein